MVLFTAAVLLDCGQTGADGMDGAGLPPSLETSWAGSGWRDLNPRPPAPKAGALPSCATPRGRPSRGGGTRNARPAAPGAGAHPSAPHPVAAPSLGALRAGAEQRENSGDGGGEGPGEARVGRSRGSQPDLKESHAPSRRLPLVTVLLLPPLLVAGRPGPRLRRGRRRSGHGDGRDRPAIYTLSATRAGPRSRASTSRPTDETLLRHRGHRRGGAPRQADERGHRGVARRGGRAPRTGRRGRRHRHRPPGPGLHRRRCQPAAPAARPPTPRTSGSTTPTATCWPRCACRWTATCFLNDVVVGPDGAAYVTDSTTPRIFRIAREGRRLAGDPLGRGGRAGRPRAGQPASGSTASRCRRTTSRCRRATATPVSCGATT